MIFDRLYVGQYIPEYRTGGNDMRMQFLDPTWVLAVGFPGITKEEIEEIRFGDLKLGYTVIDDALFFLFKFGDIPWADAPYEPLLTAKPLNYYELDEPGKGATLTVLAVDTNTGEIKAMRVCGIGHMQTNNLHRLCREKDKQRPFTAKDKAAYSKCVDMVYEKYQTSEEMLKTMPLQNFFAILQSPDDGEGGTR